MQKLSLNSPVLRLLIVGAVMLLFADSAIALDKQAALSAQERLQLGEGMYRDGKLPSGASLQGYVKGDIPVDSKAFSCSSCHLRSGLGSVEGGVFTPPTNGLTLYQARDLPGAGNNRRNAAMTMSSNTSQNSQPPLQPLPARPAHNDKTLADLLRGGRDPSGRIINSIMPRYNLNDSDMDILISYLRDLSNDYSPGVSKDHIKFATIISEDVPADQVNAMMEPIESFVKSANKQQENFEEQQIKLREFPRDPTYRRVMHSRWILRGNPDTWRGQLEQYYRKEPVFALVAGLSPKEWQPVHEFCEANKIPSILPNTDFPVVSETDSYTLYFSRGYFQEGEAAARYLLSLDKPLQGRKIVQIVGNSPQGRTLAAGFGKALEAQGIPSPVTFQQQGREPVTAEYVRRIIENEKPDLLALWTDEVPLRNAGVLSDLTKVPDMLLVSAGYLGRAIWDIPERLRDVTYLTYPYRLPQDEIRFERLFRSADKSETMTDEIKKIKGKTYAALRVLTNSLREMKGNFYRDYLFDVIGMQQDIQLPLYERLSFGPEQRYASKGCYIVQLSKGELAELVRRSEWVIH